jgi:Family of unknown function (DUF5994)
MTRSTPSTPVMPRPAARDTRSDRPARSASVRLSLDPTLCRRGAVDGGWWPRSRDARVELTALITALDARLGAISRRVGLHVDAWDNIPRRLPVGGRAIKVGWYRSTDPHGLSVTLDRGDPIQFLVIPAGTAPTPAGIAMAMAASGKDAARPTDILAASSAAAVAQAPVQQQVDRDQEHAWENEGGRTGALARQAAATASVV